MGAFKILTYLLCLLALDISADTKISFDRSNLTYGKSAAVNIKGTQLGNRNLVLSPNIPAVEHSKYFLAPITHINKLKNHVIVADQQTLYVLALRQGEVKILSRIDIPHAIKTISGNGQQIFVLGTNNTIYVYAENYEKLILKKKLKFKQSIKHIHATPSRLYIVDENSLNIYRLKTWKNAAKLATKNLGAINKLYARGRYVYLATDSSLEIINAHRLKDVSHFSSFKSSSKVIDIITQNNDIYIVEDGIGLTLLQLEKDKIRWRSSLNRSGRVYKLLNYRDRVYIDSDHTNLSLVRSHDNNTLKIFSRYYSPQPFLQSFAFKNFILTAKGNTLEWVNFNNSAVPSNINEMANYGGSRKVFIKDKLAFVADWFSGLHIYDISVEHFPKLLSSFPTKGSPKGVVVYNQHAYVADDDHGLLVIDINNPEKPRLVKSLDTPGLAYTMVLKPPFLYLADHHAGFHIINITKPEEPWIVGSFDTPGKAWSLAIKNKYAFVADDSSGVLVFDISNPQQIRKLGEYKTGHAAEDIVIRDNLAYVSFFDDGLHIIDISTAKKPKLVKSVKTHGNARGVLLGEDKAYISDWHAGVHIIDIKYPSKAKPIGYYDTPGSVWGLGLHGNTIVAMDWWAGVSILKEKNEQLELIGKYHGRGEALNVAIKDGFTYVAHGSGGLQVFDTRTALNPIWITGSDTDGEAKTVFIEQKRAYVTNGEKLIHVFDISNPFKLKKLPSITLKDSVAQIVTRQDIGFIRNKGKGWCILDLSDLSKVRKIQAFDSQISQLLLKAHNLYVIDNSRIRAYDVSVPKKAAIKTVWSISDIIAADVYNDILVAGIKNRGLSTYKLEPYSAKRLSHITTRSNIQQIAMLNDSRIIAGSVNGEIMELNFSPTKPIRLQSINPSLTPFSNFALYKQTVYLATPKNSLTSLQLLPLVEVEANETEMKAVFPANMPIGSYQLLLFDPFTGERQTLPTPIQVGAGNGKGNFSLQDLEKAMKKLKIIQ